MKQVLLVLGAVLVLSGCAVKEHMQQRDAAAADTQCRSYGAVPGSTAYVNCRAQIEAGRRAAAGAFMGGVIQNQPRGLPAQPARTGICSQQGGMTFCN